MVNIKCGMSEFNILGYRSGGISRSCPLVEYQNTRWSCPSNDPAQAMIGQTLFRRQSTNESRPIHTGSLFEVSEEQDPDRRVSVDGYRLALRQGDY